MKFRNGVFGVILVACVAGWSPAAVAESAKEFYEEAQAYFEKGEHSSAIIQLKNALQADPGFAAARLLLGKIHMLRGDVAAAEKEFRRAREAGAARDEWVEPWGRAQLAQGHPEEVLASLEPQEGDGKELRAAIFELRARALAAQSRFDEAAEALDKALAEQPGRASAFLTKAKLAAHDGHWEEAGRLVDQAVKADSSLLEGWMLKAELARRAGDLKAARDHYAKALEVAPESPIALAGLAHTHLLLGEVGEADQLVARMSKRWPNGYLINFLRGWVALQKGELNEAEEALNRALSVAPKHAPSRLIQGVVQLRLGNNNQAIEHLSAYLKAVPTDNDARRMLGAAFVKAGKPEKAIEVLEVATRSEPVDPRLLALLGNAYLRVGDHVKGLEYLEQAASRGESPAIQAQLALGYMVAGRPGEATKQLESVVAEADVPGYPDFLLVLSLLNQKKFEEAEKAASRLRKKLPDDPVAVNLVGLAYLGKGDLQAARRAFEQVVKLQPGFLLAYVNLALLARQEGNLDEARKQLDRALAVDRNNLEVLMARARLELQVGNKDMALAWFRKAHERNPEAVAPALLLVTHYLRNGEFFEALNVANAIYERHPKAPEVLDALARAQVAAGEFGGAVATLRKLDALRPGAPEVQYRLAQAYLKQDKEDLAEEALRKALERNPKHLPSRLLLSRIALDRGDTDVALALARQLKRESPDEATAYALEGAAYMKAGRYSDAAKAYRIGLDKAPTTALMLDLYKAYLGAGQKDNAEGVLKTWLAAHPEDAIAHFMFANARMNAGNYAEAVKHYRKAVDAGLKDLRLYNNLAWALSVLGDDECAEWGQRAYELAPKRPEVLDTYGWCLTRTGRSAKGLTLLQEAAVRAPHVGSIRYHMAVGLKEAGRQEEARKELERLLRKATDFPEAGEAKALLRSLGG